MKWFREHTRATIAGVILLLLLSLTVASYVNQGSNSWIGIQLERVSAFLQEPVSDAGNGVSTTIKGIFQLRQLLAEREALLEENARLRNELIEQALSRADLAELRSLTEAMNYIDPTEDYSYVTAKVIAMDGSSWYRIFTINAGTENGVRKNAVVINGDGLVGRILDVGPNWAKVITVIDENNDVSFQVFRELSLLGILSGDGEGKIAGYMLDEDAAVIEGDILVTSGMEIYPQGIPIGKVSRITWDKDALLRTVEIEPAVDFTKVQKVTVIMTVAADAEQAEQ
ncbi:MAG: rod shape-determining protein MreC [Clostridiales bacterium]|nr:rod shape-determining protein MreC [Clostridiales bacterium]